MDDALLDGLRNQSMVEHTASFDTDSSEGDRSVLSDINEVETSSDTIGDDLDEELSKNLDEQELGKESDEELDKEELDEELDEHEWNNGLDNKTDKNKLDNESDRGAGLKEDNLLKDKTNVVLEIPENFGELILLHNIPTMEKKKECTLESFLELTYRDFKGKCKKNQLGAKGKHTVLVERLFPDFMLPVIEKEE